MTKIGKKSVTFAYYLCTEIIIGSLSLISLSHIFYTCTPVAQKRGVNLSLEFLIFGFCTFVNLPIFYLRFLHLPTVVVACGPYRASTAFVTER